MAEQNGIILEDDPNAAVRFPTKIVVVVRDDLAAWQRVNATAFMISGIAAGTPETVGAPYEDATGQQYNPMFREPVYVYAASGDKLRRAYTRALQREVTISVFTGELFTTGHDAANRAAVRAVSGDQLSLVGIAFRTERKTADKITDGLSFHP